jgi:hypothetical protein
MNPTSNPWAAPFEALIGRGDLTSLMTRQVDPIQGLNSLPVDTAPTVLKAALESIYIAQTQETTWARTCLGIAHDLAIVYYSTPLQFVHDVHHGVSLSENPITRMVTSEAGWGKSKTAHAIVNLFSEPQVFEVGRSLPPQRVVGIIRLRIDTNSSLAGLLNALAKQAGFPEDYSSGGTAEINRIRKQMYIAGVMLIIVDELQFLSRSASASTLISKTLLVLRQIGVPLMFIGNYSLGHKLLTRPQEDQHRFLEQPIVLLPDTHDSPGFQDLIAAYVKSMNGNLQLDPKADAKLLHWYTGGNRRIICELVVMAYSFARRTAAARGSIQVTINDIGNAYASDAFGTRRKEVEICRQQLVQNRMVKKDLWCPFRLSPDLLEHRALLAKELQRSEIDNAALRAAATPQEIAGMQAMQAVFTTTEPGVLVPAKPRREKKKKPTVDDLLATRPSYYG